MRELTYELMKTGPKEYARILVVVVGQRKAVAEIHLEVILPNIHQTAGHIAGVPLHYTGEKRELSVQAPSRESLMYGQMKFGTSE